METDGMWYEILSPLKPRLHGVIPSYGPQTLSEVPPGRPPFGPKGPFEHVSWTDSLKVVISSGWKHPILDPLQWRS